MQIPQLTFLRFVAALGVVLFHFGQTTAPWSSDCLLPAVQQAGLGVGFFFTLSGFLMAWVYGAKEKLVLGDYVRARFARIMPLYWLSFLLALVVELLVRDKRPRGLSIILQVLGLQAWVPGYSLTLNFPSWSVSVELFFYLMFPVLIGLLRRRHALVLLGTALGLMLACTYVFLHIGAWTQGWIDNPNSDLSLRFPAWQLHTFVTGLVGGLLYQRGLLRLPTSWLPGLVFVLGSAAMLALAYVPNPVIGIAGGGLLAPLYLVMILAMAQDRGPLAQAFSWAPMVFLGEMSYGVYLLQAPVYIAMEPLARAAGAPGLAGGWLYLYILALLLVSAVAYQWFERPARAWLRPAGK